MFGVAFYIPENDHFEFEELQKIISSISTFATLSANSEILFRVLSIFDMLTIII